MEPTKSSTKFEQFLHDSSTVASKITFWKTPGASAGSSKFTWQYQDAGGWKSYDATIASQLDAAASGSAPWPVKFSPAPGVSFGEYCNH